MTSFELYVARHKAEQAGFLKVLKAIPAGKRDYRPDPKARTAMELAWMLASEEAGLVTLLDKGEVAWEETAPPARSEEIVALFEKSASEADKRLASFDAARWGQKARFLMGGTPVWEDTLEQMAWGFLFDAIHHRGQLSTYLRPMGGKVPAIYGPSADDKGE
jgi:uncharacterized damage-inducible protein DinB